MMSSTRNRRRSVVASAAIAVALLTACGAQPGSDVSIASTAPTSSSAVPTAHPDVTAAAAQQVVLPRSTPVSIDIPSTGTTSHLLSLGLNPDKTLEVPRGDPGAPAGWYNLSPTPGELGPAVVLGHVNATDGGPGVFADLRKLQAGDTINIEREDGSTAAFAVQHGEQYEKDSFPTQKVYGDTDKPELRLITCDGYNPETGNFDDNYVVYAALIEK